MAKKENKKFGGYNGKGDLYDVSDMICTPTSSELDEMNEEEKKECEPCVKLHEMEDIEPSCSDCSVLKIDKPKPAANSLSKQHIKKLFRMFCVYRNVEPCLEECSACILRDIPWNKVDVNGEILRGTQIKDLCYAIWHEGILND